MKNKQNLELYQRVKDHFLFKRMEVEVDERYRELIYISVEEKKEKPNIEDVSESVLMEHIIGVKEIKCAEKWLYAFDEILDAFYELLTDSLMNECYEVPVKHKEVFFKSEWDTYPTLYELNDISNW